MTTLPLLLAAALAANASGKTLVRQQQGTVVPISATARPLISAVDCNLTHLRWNGSAMVDIRGSGWAMTGTVPQNAKAPPIPASAGVFSDANYYSLGSGSDALDAATISMCVVITYTSLPGLAGKVIANDGLANTDGWYLLTGDGTSANVVYFNALSAGSGATGRANTAGTVIAGLNVICAGFNGSTNTSAVKLNLGTYATKAKGSAMTLATTRAAYLGRYVSAGSSLAEGKIHEVCVSSAAPTDAAFIAAMNEVKTKTGTTAW